MSSTFKIHIKIARIKFPILVYKQKYIVNNMQLHKNVNKRISYKNTKN